MGIDVTWTHDGMTVRQSGNTRFTWVLVVFLWVAIGANVLDGLTTPWSASLVAVFPWWLINVLPRRLEIRGDWLTLVGAGRSRVRLEDVEEVRLDRWDRLVFTLRGGRRRRLWLRAGFVEAERNWVLERLRDAVVQARAKEATRDPADEASRRALAALKRDASTQR
ncbi:MAG: hypothetical protein AAF211_23300 [Myxococcota bacterium]